MAKDLSGTNVAVQKEATFYTPIGLLEIVRDHPETGESIYRVSTWSGPYALTNTYADRIVSISDVRQYMNSGGGLALIGDLTFELLNPEGLPTNRRLSDMLDDYFLENDEVRFWIVFRTGSETVSDRLRLYTGLVQDVQISTKGFRFQAKDGTRVTLRDVPQEFLDRVQWIDAPLNVQDVPYPVPFGNMNVEPFNTTGDGAVLGPCICVDVFESKYTPGLLCKSYGQPYVFYRSARIYGRIESYTQSGAYFTVDSSSRFASILPMRPTGTNDVTDWKNVADRDSTTVASVDNGDNLDLRMRGCPKIGTVTAIEVKVQGSGSAVDYVISKTGEVNITGTTAGYPAAIDLSGWDFSTNWDFENIEVQLDGTGTTTIWSLTLDIVFDEQETGDKLAFPIFQSITGYEDVAAQYQDGAVIVSANQLLRNPIYQACALMRDKRTGMRLATAEIETTGLAAEVAKISDWYFDFSITDTLRVNDFSEFLKQGKIRMFRTYDNKWKFNVYDETDDPVAAFFDDTNIATTARNAIGRPSQRETSFELYQSPLNEVYNEIVVDYGWNPALTVHTKQTVATHHYNLTGTATLDATAGTLTDGSATFQTDGVQVGHKVFVIRDKLYDVDSINSETVLGVSPSDPTKPMSNRTDTYYLGPNYDFNCHRSLLKYKQPNRLTVKSVFIQDDDTAEAVLQYLIDYYSQRRYMGKFRTWLNAVDVEIADLAIVDHANLPPMKRPANLGTTSGATSKSATTVTLAGTGAALCRIDDRLVVKSGGTKLYRECWKVLSLDAAAGTIDVTRGYSGTDARPWPSGSVVQRVIPKWEVVEIRTIKSTNEIELTVRESARDYSPIGHAAPATAVAWASATPEERALYGFCSYPNGEVSWLDEDSAVSFARTS